MVSDGIKNTPLLAERRTVGNGGRISGDVKDEVEEANKAKNGGVVRCEDCGVEVTDEPGHPNSKEFDHRQPWSRGGGGDATNVCIRCRTDNRGKGAMTEAEWAEKQRQMGMQPLFEPKKEE